MDILKTVHYFTNIYTIISNLMSTIYHS